MAEQKTQPIERRIYTARFRRDLTSLKPQLDDPAYPLQRVVIVRRRTGEPVAELITAAAYATAIENLK